MLWQSTKKILFSIFLYRSGTIVLILSFIKFRIVKSKTGIGKNVCSTLDSFQVSMWQRCPCPENTLNYRGYKSCRRGFHSFYSRLCSKLNDLPLKFTSKVAGFTVCMALLVKGILSDPFCSLRLLWEISELVDDRYDRFEKGCHSWSHSALYLRLFNIKLQLLSLTCVVSGRHMNRHSNCFCLLNLIIIWLLTGVSMCVSVLHRCWTDSGNAQMYLCTEIYPQWALY